MKPLYHLNAEPVIFLQLTPSEWEMNGLVSVIAGMFTGIFMGLLFQNVLLGMFLFITTVIVTVIFNTKLLQKLKRDRPRGWYVQKMATINIRLGFGKPTDVTRVGTWDLGRRL